MEKYDPELFSLIQLETKRQSESIELIASENVTSIAVQEALGSILTNKYSEGNVGKRYYGGNEYIDQIEQLAINRALNAFNLKSDKWGVNVQPYSGSVANMAAYLSVINVGDRIMGLDLPSGGHLTHGFGVSATSKIFQSKSYKLGDQLLMDYDQIKKNVLEWKPHLLICGYSAYPRKLDFKKFREIADTVGAYLLCDMAHFAGFVATGLHPSPFEWCDIVTTTTHKTLRGPRAGMIFFKREYEKRVNFSVFPALQGGPHQNQIAGIAVQMKEVATPEFKEYIQQVNRNAQALAERLIELEFDVLTGGSDNHIVMVNLKNKGITGSKMEKLCERFKITINKNTIQGDTSALSPSGIRLGTAAMTTRGYKEGDFKRIADKLNEIVEIGLKIQKEYGSKLTDFIKGLDKI